MRHPRLTQCAFALALAVSPAIAATKPRIPAGQDPGGTAIAIISTGIDYTDPAISACLARDGEGELIGWDFVDNDRRPWRAPEVASSTPANWGRDTDALTKLIPCKGRNRIIPVRIDPEKPITLGQALEFISQTPARIAVVPMWSSAVTDWTAFGSAANAFKTLLIIAAAGDENINVDQYPVYPTAFSVDAANWSALPNLVVAASARGDTRTQTSTSNHGLKSVTLTVMEAASDQPAPATPEISPSGRAAVEVAWSLTCSLSRTKVYSTAIELKQRLLELRRFPPAADGRNLFDPGCRTR